MHKLIPRKLITLMWISHFNSACFHLSWSDW